MDVTTLELDLGLTKDLVPVVIHDPYLNQNLCLDGNGDSITTDTLGYGPLLSNLTLKEIKIFDGGSLNPEGATWFGVRLLNKFVEDNYE